MLILVPILIGVGFLLGQRLGFPLARLHPTVRLAAYMPQGDQFSQKELRNFRKSSNHGLTQYRPFAKPVSPLRSWTPRPRVIERFPLAGRRPGGVGRASSGNQTRVPVPAATLYRLPA